MAFEHRIVTTVGVSSLVRLWSRCSGTRSFREWEGAPRYVRCGRLAEVEMFRAGDTALAALGMALLIPFRFR